ncbi:MAG: 2Fe-2S iron-sulfur cluster-binding protein [Candidatus Zophobacter franzmannii]|nr:2Fe-2S iron-sulfur cluster-binding protein [Candidatus Zophobacter franzmannii]
MKAKQMMIDGQKIEILPTDKNIVDVTTRNKIPLPAPCYIAKRTKGCCNACAVEISGKQKFACTTSPEDGMNITINRDDLNLIRKERLKKYSEGIKNNSSCGCSCSDSDSKCC